MRGATLLVLLAGLALVGYLAARARGSALDRSSSLPAHHGWFVVAWTLLPSLAFVGVWTLVAPALVTDAVLATPAAVQLPPPGFERASILAEARELGLARSRDAFHPAARALAPAYAAAQSRFASIEAAVALLLAFAGGAWAFSRVRPGFPARARTERLVGAALLIASLAAILVTAGIVASLLWEAVRFFALVPATDFLFGAHWSPQSIEVQNPGASLGSLPLFWGTFFIGAVIAMLVAAPLGLLSAVYLTQYAAPATRRRVKPMLEVLAGVPTVVYGYFAALTVAPAVRELGIAIGVERASAESALAAGLVMGAMLIPYVSSLADDSLAAVPAALAEASLAMGATRGETIRRILLPAALPGVVGGLLLAISRAVGETMIVVMAASAVATLTLDPFAPATTVTRQIVDLLTGEAAFDGPKTLAAFALGLALFALTFLLNMVALGIMRRYRRAYE